MPRHLSQGHAPLSAKDILKQPVWDLPTRLFHWTLVALIAFSWWSAENHHLDWHLWAGLGVISLLLFRLLWGFVGSSTARFASFVRGPRAVVAFLRDEKSWRAAGHTPLGALSVVAILAVVGADAALGLIAADEDGFNQGPLAHLVSIDASDAARELHEMLFNGLLALIILHVAAILYYRLFRRKKLVGPMITGRGELEDGVAPMRPGRWWVAVVCLAIAIGMTRWLIAGAPPFGG
ncbi:MAG: cytochrome b/b6 domain-containing protein [Sphingomicrobium sp.]